MHLMRVPWLAVELRKPLTGWFVGLALGIDITVLLLRTAQLRFYTAHETQEITLSMCTTGDSVVTAHLGGVL